MALINNDLSIKKVCCTSYKFDRNKEELNRAQNTRRESFIEKIKDNMFFKIWVEFRSSSVRWLQLASDNVKGSCHVEQVVCCWFYGHKGCDGGQHT